MRFVQMTFLLAAVLLTGTVSAQATEYLSGSVSGDDDYWYILDIDFGTGPTSADIDLTIAATSGSSGLEVTLIDLDAVAANGLFSGAADGDNDPGLGNISLSVTSAAYSGVVQFAVIVETDSGSGTSPFMGVVTSSGLASGAITINHSANIPFVVNQIRNLFDRVTSWYHGTSGNTTVQREFTVDFGSTPQAVTFNAQLQAIGATVTAEVYEIDGGGTPQLLTTLSAAAGGFDEDNPTSSSRSGSVTFRIVVTTPSSAQFAVHTVWPSGATISAVDNPGGGSGGGGGGSDGGCSTNSGTGGWLLLAGALAGSVLLVRSLRRDRVL